MPEAPVIPQEALQAAAEAARADAVEMFREPIKPVEEFVPEVRHIVEAAADGIRADERRKVAEQIAEGIPENVPIWADDDELAAGHFTDRTYAWWREALGHPSAHPGCCRTCGCAAPCLLGAFYDSVEQTLARQIGDARDSR